MDDDHREIGELRPKIAIMDLKGKIKQLLVSPFFVTLIISFAIYSFVPFKIEKFKTEQLSRTTHGPEVDTYYYDLDNDGNSEKIELYKTVRVGIIVYSKGRVLDQWNFDKTFNGNLSYRYGITVNDVDNDGNSEIILTTHFDGSILLHCFSPLKAEVLFKDRKVAAYTLMNDEINTSVAFTEVYDYNHDGLNEIYFVLQSGYSKHPRSMNAYDFKNDTILSSPAGCNLFTFPKKGDIDSDGVPEFYANSSAVGNCEKDSPYSDHFSWFTVFSPDMKFRFEPVITGIYPSFFQARQYKVNGKNLFAGLQIYQGTESSACYIALYDDTGNVIKKAEFEFSPKWLEAVLLPQSNPGIIPILKTDGTLLYYDASLNIVSSIKCPPFVGFPVILDLDQDGIEEFIFQSAGMDKIIIAQSDFSAVNELDLSEKVRTPKFSLKLSVGKLPELFVQGMIFNHTFLYFSNPFYTFRWLIFPALFLIVLGFTSVLYKLQKIRISQKYEAERQLIELQLKSIKNQLDPHFTLNLIASIGDLFDKKDDKTTRYVFNKYSTLLRHSIINSDQFMVSLPTELEFVKNYLALEKFRLDDRFDFEITQDVVDEKIKIPKMLVHSFVENAVKHGIKHRENGKIQVNSMVERKNCLITVRDNGIGREKSREIAKFSTGKGFRLSTGSLKTTIT